MLYGFDVSIGGRDYFEYNKFHILRSPYGKKYRMMVCAALCAFALAAILLMVLVLGLSLEALIAAVPIVLLSVVLMIVYPYVVVLISRIHIALTKNSAKKSYSPYSKLEFFEDSFAEQTDVGRTETKYSVIDRISVTDGAIYLHLNATAAYILPTELFESDDELDGFLDFLKSKNDRITVYRRKNNVKGNS